MDNKQLQRRLEIIKELVDGLSEPIYALQDPEHEIIMKYGNHLRGFDLIYQGEVNNFVSQLSSKELSPEVLALVATVDLLIKEVGKKLVSDLNKERARNPAKEEKQPDLPPVVAQMLEDLKRAGLTFDDMQLIRLDNHDCGNPDCEVHGKKPVKEDQKN